MPAMSSLMAGSHFACANDHLHCPNVRSAERTLSVLTDFCFASFDFAPFVISFCSFSICAHG